MGKWQQYRYSGLPTMEMTGLSHLLKWENLNNWWVVQYPPPPACPVFGLWLQIQSFGGKPLVPKESWRTLVSLSLMQNLLIFFQITGPTSTGSPPSTNRVRSAVCRTSVFAAAAAQQLLSVCRRPQTRGGQQRG